MKAFAGTVHEGQDNNNGDIPDWICRAKDCNNKISKEIRDMIITSRKKKDNPSVECPYSLLCKHHHDQFTIKSVDITLETGEKKKRASHKKAKANAATIEDEDAKDNDKPTGELTKKQQRNKKQNERRKAAMALLRAQEKAEAANKTQEGNPPASATNSSPASATSEPNPTVNFDPGSLSAENLVSALKYAAASGLAQGANGEQHDGQQESKDNTASSTQTSGNVVKKIINMLENQTKSANSVKFSSTSEEKYYIPE